MICGLHLVIYGFRIVSDQSCGPSINVYLNDIPNGSVRLSGLIKMRFIFSRMIDDNFYYCISVGLFRRGA